VHKFDFRLFTNDTPNKCSEKIRVFDSISMFSPDRRRGC
jgi:hypothetical protein